VKADRDLTSIFEKEADSAAILSTLKASGPGKAFLAKVDAYAREFGYKAIYAHEYTGKLAIEDPAPIIGEVKGYYASGFDYDSVYRKCIDEQEGAIQQLRSRLAAASLRDRERFEEALRLNLSMLPLTADHHFYFDQSTYARLRLVLLAVGRKMVKEGLLDAADDIMMLEYDQLRKYVGNPKGYDGRAIIAESRRAMERARGITPRDWVGTVTQQNMYEEPYHTLWGYPEKFERQQKEKKVKGQVRGVPASAGVVEGVARVVHSPAEFNEVKRGEIMVCTMTNPAWVVVFAKIAGLVTDAGGALAHSAVVAREFMIPAVVGTATATKEIKTGDRVRVDGGQGLVEIL